MKKGKDNNYGVCHTSMIYAYLRLNEIMFPGGKLPLNFVIKLPTPKIHWLPPTNPHIIILTGQNALSTSQSYPGASSVSKAVILYVFVSQCSVIIADKNNLALPYN